MLESIGSILLTIILPVFILIGVGGLLDKTFKLDLATLSKLNFYIFVPALVFAKFLNSPVAFVELGGIALLTVAHKLVMWGVSELLFSLPRFRDKRATLTLGALFYNAGNYGLPLAGLAFPDGGIEVMAIIMAVQNFLNFSVGIFILERDKSDLASSMSALFRAPVILAFIGALGLRALELYPPQYLQKPLDYLADGLIPVALLTLGVQLARRVAGADRLPLQTVCAVRLLLSPAVAAGIVMASHALGIAVAGAEVFIVACGLPVAVNVFILSVEYKANEELASAMIFWSTLLSAVSVSVIVWLVH